MKVLWTCLLACFVLRKVAAQKHLQNRERGFSDQYRSENTLGQYTFGYNEDHTSGGSFRREAGDRFGNKIGSYGLRIADGRMRIVNYIADHNGYRADVISNEHGIASQNSNGYMEIRKGNLKSVVVPGLSYSGDAPHLTFSGDAKTGSVDTFSQSQQTEYQSTYKGVGNADGIIADHQPETQLSVEGVLRHFDSDSDMDNVHHDEQVYDKGSTYLGAETNNVPEVKKYSEGISIGQDSDVIHKSVELGMDDSSFSRTDDNNSQTLNESSSTGISVINKENASVTKS